MPKFPAIKTRLSLGECENLGLTLAANVLTICQEDGSALAPGHDNYARIGMPDTTPGLKRTMIVSANATITDGDGGQLGSNSLGITVTANWAYDAPNFLYAINFGNSTVYFGISRNPCLTVTPATVYYKNVGGANTQADILCMTDSGGDDLAAKPCVLIGSIRMQWTT